MIILSICIILKLLRGNVNFMDIEKMSLNSLKKYSTFLNHIRSEAELSNNFDFLCIGHEDKIYKEGIAGLGFKDYDAIFWSLAHIGVIADRFHADNGNFFLTLDKGKFYELCSGIDNAIKDFDKPKVNAVEEDDFSIIKKLNFDNEKSILVINDCEIEISKQRNNSMAHDVLRCLFDISAEPQIFYSELVYKILGIDEVGYKARDEELWRKIYRACEDVQNKVLKGTNYKIDDFLDYNTGVRGSVQIKEKYRLR